MTSRQLFKGRNPNRSRNVIIAPQKLYPRIKKARQRTELDRATWSTTQLLIATYDTVGSGVVETELIDFGLVFDGPPFFSYVVEVQPDQQLIPNDFPEITVGVKSWETTDADGDTRSTPFYLGAFLWMSIGANSSYRLRFRLSFEGTTMRNVEYFRGLNG